MKPNLEDIDKDILSKDQREEQYRFLIYGTQDMRKAAVDRLDKHNQAMDKKLTIKEFDNDYLNQIMNRESGKVG